MRDDAEEHIPSSAAGGLAGEGGSLIPFHHAVDCLYLPSLRVTAPLSRLGRCQLAFHRSPPSSARRPAILAGPTGSRRDQRLESYLLPYPFVCRFAVVACVGDDLERSVRNIASRLWTRPARSAGDRLRLPCRSTPRESDDFPLPRRFPAWEVCGLSWNAWISGLFRGLWPSSACESPDSGDRSAC